ncbi:MAG: hypothetical protein U9Q79_09190 [Candidatus Hydrogenedentes bacterium]|nr:hypothetical protein [Candidatus Hydrogenedentota bacterium]
MARLTESHVEQATLVKLLFGEPRVKDAAYMIKDRLQTQERNHLVQRKNTGGKWENDSMEETDRDDRVAVIGVKCIKRFHD